MKCAVLLAWLVAATATGQLSFASSAIQDMDRIADALKAGPPYITDHATVLEWPTAPGGNYRVLRAGTNGWTCLPGFPGTPHDEPMCLDPVFLKFFQDAVARRPLRVDRVGISYMYAGGWVPNSPHAAAAPTDYHVGPHIMIVVPNGTGLADYTTDVRAGGAYINRVPGTGMPYLVIPIHEWPRE